MVRNIAVAAAIAVVATTALFLVNLAVTGLGPDRYRDVVLEAMRDGTLTRTVRQPLAPGREIPLVGGTDCLVLGMLVVRRDTPVMASISPRVPDVHDRVLEQPEPGFGNDLFCRLLGKTMGVHLGKPVAVTVLNHHRYLHGTFTLAALTLALVPLRVAGLVWVSLCFFAVAVLALAAVLRMRSPDPDERRRALTFLIIAAALATFYALPIFGRAFAHAPSDLVLIGFLLFGLLFPVNALPERTFAIVVALFGAAIAILEMLTGGIPIGLAAVITVVALGGAPQDVAPAGADPLHHHGRAPGHGIRAALAGVGHALMRRRLIVGVACYAAAITACFVTKLVGIALVWGPDEVGLFFGLLGMRMIGEIGAWPLLDQWAARFGFDAGLFDRSVLARLVVTFVMITYSGFVLAWGSHALGAALVLLPVPLLAVLTCVAQRRVDREQWRLLPQPLLLVASLVPFAWYLAFTWHTATHSYFMVRPLALNVALVAIAAVLLPRRRVLADDPHRDVPRTQPSRVPAP